MFSKSNQIFNPFTYIPTIFKKILLYNNSNVLNYVDEELYFLSSIWLISNIILTNT